MKVKEVIEHLQHYDPNMPIAYSLWQPGDIHARANDMAGVKLTNEEIGEIINGLKLDLHYEAIWEHIEMLIDDILEKRGENAKKQRINQAGV